MNNELKVSLHQTVVLLQNSLQELSLYIHTPSPSDKINDSAKTLEVIEKMTVCEKEIREYLNTMEGRNKSKRFKLLMDTLSDSLDSLSRLENLTNSEVSEAARDPKTVGLPSLKSPETAKDPKSPGTAKDPKPLEVIRKIRKPLADCCPPEEERC